jgi:hypothetical protein
VSYTGFVPGQAREVAQRVLGPSSRLSTQSLLSVPSLRSRYATVSSLHEPKGHRGVGVEVH